MKCQVRVILASSDEHKSLLKIANMVEKRIVPKGASDFHPDPQIAMGCNIRPPSLVESVDVLEQRARVRLRRISPAEAKETIDQMLREKGSFPTRMIPAPPEDTDLT
ncbi:MAG: hypothetical protein NUV69_01660 [Candidatus Curtissbacteria bacterium]|nr:hypothetical protein [Candidatus Curtissbacteria bacterium]